MAMLITEKVIIFIFIVLGMFHMGESVPCKGVCEFTFVVRWSRLMTWRSPENLKAFNVMLDGERLKVVRNAEKRLEPEIWQYVEAAATLTGDGYPRDIITINGQFPGPTIEVVHGAEVVVNVVNELQVDGISIHWHGMRMEYNPWMDGAAFVSQCPQKPMSTFTYRFKANPVGTHWYHSHYESQRLDGLFGLFVVHPNIPEPEPFFPLVLTDWYHYTAQEQMTANPYRYSWPGTGQFDEPLGTGNEPVNTPTPVELPTTTLYEVSALINGRGRYNNEKFPLEIFTFDTGTKYKFRAANAGSNYPYKISIDQHKLTVVATDGCNIQPQEVDGVIVFTGETVDFEVTANKPIGRYWMRIKVADKSDYVVRGIVAYGNSLTGDPTSSETVCQSSSRCKIFNCPVGAYPPSAYTDCIPIDALRALKSEPELFTGDGSEIHEIFLNMGYSYGPSINGFKLRLPSLPLSDGEGGVTKCSETSCENGCECTHIIDLPYNKTIQLVMTNYGPDPEQQIFGHHPVHVHGHGFAVLKLGYPPFNAVTGEVTGGNPDVICDDPDPFNICKNPRWASGGGPTSFNLVDPPIKNTVIIPSLGYTILRFNSYNPGYWLLHCHKDPHSTMGMSLVLKEAAEWIPRPPKDFPKCLPFEYTQKQYELDMKSNKLLQKVLGNEDDMEEWDEEEEEEEEECKEYLKSKEGVQVSVSTLVGAILGSVVLGAVLVVIPVFLYMRRSRSKP